MDINEIYRQVIEFVSNYTWNIVGAILVFVIGKWLARRLTKLLAKLLRRQGVDEMLIRFLDNISYYALLIVVIMAAADQLGINTSSFLAIFGAAGLAVGLALKDSLGNFASGVMLVMFRPFGVGDAVTAGGVTGKVERISVFNTTLLTFDNQLMIIPNGKITNDVIINITANPTRRLDMVFGISYDDDIKLAKEIFQKALDNEERVHKEPAPLIAVSELADSSVNFFVRPWVDTDKYWAVKYDLTEKIKLELEAAGITIPFPQRDVHYHKTEE